MEAEGGEHGGTVLTQSGSGQALQARSAELRRKVHEERQKQATPKRLRPWWSQSLSLHEEAAQRDLASVEDEAPYEIL